LAQGLVTGSERRGARPEQMVAYVCQEPSPGESGRDVKRRLEPLVHLLRTQCGELDVPVIEALCVSDGRYWSYCCPIEGCCPEDGSPMGLPGTSVLAAAATYAGIQVRGTLRELRARLQPWETSAALEQEIALDAAGMTLVPRILDEASRAEVAEETLRLAERIMRRFAAAAPVSGTHPADLRDDRLLAHDEAAALILGLQDRTTRDRAAAWMEGDEAGPALRLWRALARRCVGPYGEHAAAPLTLAGWVAWSTGDELEAREALAMALGADPDYLFARLLHQACNEGLDPEAIRRCLRADRGTSTPEENGAQPSRRKDTARAGLPPADGAGAGVRVDALGTEGDARVDPRDAGTGVGGDGQAAGAGRGTGTRRRRRVRSAETGAAPRAARSTGGRRRPAGSYPGSSAAEPARPGSRGLGGSRTRGAESGGTTAGAAVSRTDRCDSEGEG
jgi:hypothetical protein